MHNFNIVLFVAAIYLLSIAAQACTKYCNNNGFCYIEDGIEKCRCLDRIYVGESCNESVNHCVPNPCKNGGTCVSAPGQYNCLCLKNVYGQNCTMKSEKKYFGQVLLQYNHITPISNDNHFLIVLTDLGTVNSTVEIVTSNYAIAGGIYLPSLDFRKTNDIQVIAKKFKVPSSSLPDGDVFYYAGKYRMARDGVALVTFTITDAVDAALGSYYVWYFQFGSAKNLGCNPLVTIADCGTPSLPVSKNVNQMVFVEANVRRDCGPDSRFSYKWSIANYFDASTLQSFNGSSRSLKIPAFGIHIDYNEDDIFSRFKVIKLISLERSADGNRFGETVNRCYIEITMDAPIAKISGGYYQEYSHKQQIVMDGSESVDLSLHPKKNQNLTYLWRCSNGGDEFCKNFNKTGTLQSTHSTFILVF